jgi:hypothetical protein
MTDARGQKRSSPRVVERRKATSGLPRGGVGGRQATPPSPPQGGGYLDIHSISNFCEKPDQRLGDLRAMGLPAHLLRAAEAIGADAFLAFWRIMDQEPSTRTDKGDIELRMRPYRSYLRYQRNRYIEQLTALGKTPADIREAVRLHLCERISLRHIYRVMAGK